MPAIITLPNTERWMLLNDDDVIEFADEVYQIAGNYWLAVNDSLVGEQCHPGLPPIRRRMRLALINSHPAHVR